MNVSNFRPRPSSLGATPRTMMSSRDEIDPNIPSWGGTVTLPIPYGVGEGREHETWDYVYIYDYI